MPPAGPPGFPPPPPTGYAPTYGQQPVGYGNAQQTPTNSGKSVAVLVLGISGIVTLFCFIGIIPAIVGLCLAPGAKREIRASNGWRTGEGMTLAGVICCWVAVGLFVALALLVALGYVTRSPTSSTYGA